MKIGILIGLFAFTTAGFCQNPSPSPSAAPAPGTGWIAPATRNKTADATRMRGPSGRSWWVRNEPLLTATPDISYAVPSGRTITSLDSISIGLTATGQAKLSSAKLGPDDILVAVWDQEILGDEIVGAEHKDTTRLIIRGRLSKTELETARKALHPVPPVRAGASGTVIQPIKGTNLSAGQNTGTAWLAGQVLQIMPESGETILLRLDTLGEKGASYSWHLKTSNGTKSRGQGKIEGGYAQVYLGDDFTITWSRGTKPEKSWLFLPQGTVTPVGPEIFPTP